MLVYAAVIALFSPILYLTLSSLHVSALGVILRDLLNSTESYFCLDHLLL
jgi:hypothetical protein